MRAIAPPALRSASNTRLSGIGGRLAVVGDASDSWDASLEEDDASAEEGEPSLDEETSLDDGSSLAADDDDVSTDDIASEDGATSSEELGAPGGDETKLGSVEDGSLVDADAEDGARIEDADGGATETSLLGEDCSSDDTAELELSLLDAELAGGTDDVTLADDDSDGTDGSSLDAEGISLAEVTSEDGAADDSLEAEDSSDDDDELWSGTRDAMSGAMLTRAATLVVPVDD